MKFALIYQGQLPKPWTNTCEYTLFQEVVEQVNFAEEVGFEGVWFMEHHFAPEQSHASAPEMILAALSQRIRHRRLGLAVVLVPIHSQKGADTRGGDTITGRDLVDARRFPMGDPEDCIKIIEQFEAIGGEELMFNCQLGAVSDPNSQSHIRPCGDRSHLAARPAHRR